MLAALFDSAPLPSAARQTVLDGQRSGISSIGVLIGF